MFMATVMSDVEKANSELLAISYSITGIKTASLKKTEGHILMRGKTNLQQELGKTGQKSKQVQNGLQRE